jgi:hypothetical protein
MTKFCAFLLVAVCICWSLPGAAYVCTRSSADGPSLAWGEREIELRVTNIDGNEISVASLQEGLEHAVNEWTDAAFCSDLVIRAGAPTNHTTAGFDWAAGSQDPANMNIVVFRKNESETTVDRWLYPLSAIALTTVTYVNSSGRILDADIELNDAYHDFTNCDPGSSCIVITDLKNTLTHELGHVVGLDHPLGNDAQSVGATMASSAPEGELEKRDLSQDDIDGLCYLYPLGGETQECYGAPVSEPANVSVAHSGCGGSEFPTDLATFMFVPAIIARKRQKRSQSPTRGGLCRS